MKSTKTYRTRIIAALAAVVCACAIAVVCVGATGAFALGEISVLGVGTNQSTAAAGVEKDFDLYDDDALGTQVHPELDGAINTLVTPTERVVVELLSPEEFEQAIAQAEAALKAEEERKAQEEAERKAKEEAERKAKEEAERKAKEEAERKAKEEAARKAQEAQKNAEKARKDKEATPQGWSKAVASVYHNVGEPVATGGVLSASDMIVAHKTLPLGTKVQIRYKGNTVTATVGDRGPYIAGRDFDLAPGIQDALGVHDGVFSISYRILN